MLHLYVFVNCFFFLSQSTRVSDWDVFTLRENAVTWEWMWEGKIRLKYSNKKEYGNINGNLSLLLLLHQKTTRWQSYPSKRIQELLNIVLHHNIKSSLCWFAHQMFPSSWILIIKVNTCNTSTLLSFVFCYTADKIKYLYISISLLNSYFAT